MHMIHCDLASARSTAPNMDSQPDRHRYDPTPPTLGEKVLEPALVRVEVVGEGGQIRVFPEQYLPDCRGLLHVSVVVGSPDMPALPSGRGVQGEMESQWRFQEGG